MNTSTYKCSCTSNGQYFLVKPQIKIIAAVAFLVQDFVRHTYQRLKIGILGKSIYITISNMYVGEHRFLREKIFPFKQ